ncbi:MULTISPECIES: hypothetical protein [unclassified Frondihabitans]|uniref:hypothetical protein n=1 Tax=unclassified Frondihabitans TaxID=2626248 RepID=UPI000F4DE57F|nr:MULTISPECIES: hypothetical protein [unclassified Frondihabitans]RPE75202.1 hypothetical protein EDF37_2806 [Frondihabitans sp. PhB153]RPF04444.1 hypothetical protein EDF39_2874 [Frondihabitans sp. PhB161]
MTNIEIYAGTLTANREERVVSGLLLPFGEQGQTNLGRLTIDRGVLKLPEDYSVLNANLDHDHSKPVASTLTLTETEHGVYGSWRVAKGAEGDELLAAKAGDPNARRNLSVEAAIQIKNGRAIGGHIHGAAFVKEGAFPSATLLAALAPDTEELPPAEVDPEVKPTDVKTQHDGSVAIATDVLPLRIDVTTADQAGNATVTPYTTSTKPPTTPKETTPVATATAPATLQASVVPTKATSVFEALRAARKGDDTLLAALADIKTSGAGALPGAGVVQPAWLGEIWTEKTYERKFWSLVKNGNLTNMDEKGFVLDAAEPLVQPYSGNKASVPTGTGTTSLVSSEFQRWAVAVDIAREFFDIPGNNEVIDAFLKRFFSDYAKVTDKWALQKFYAAAGTAVPVASGQHVEYNDSITKLITAVDSLDDTDVEPSFVIVAPDVFKELRFTPKDKVPEYITFSANRQDGTADGVQVLRDKFGVLGAGEVLVGAHDAAHLNELPGASPLTVDAIDIARGGIDKAVHGYSQSLIEYADGFQLFGNAAA